MGKVKSLALLPSFMIDGKMGNIIHIVYFLPLVFVILNVGQTKVRPLSVIQQ